MEPTKEVTIMKTKLTDIIPVEIIQQKIEEINTVPIGLDVHYGQDQFEQDRKSISGDVYKTNINLQRFLEEHPEQRIITFGTGREYRLGPKPFTLREYDTKPECCMSVDFDRQLETVMEKGTQDTYLVCSHSCGGLVDYSEYRQYDKGIRSNPTSDIILATYMTIGNKPGVGIFENLQELVFEDGSISKGHPSERFQVAYKTDQSLSDIEVFEKLFS